ncbi:MAG: triose-phosphate isomerase [Clostridia bacterium]|nr:triose-phosphate isomerase [Clostridia bacterium]
MENKRKKLIAGNWKMNKTYDDAKTLLSELAVLKSPPCDVAVCVPFIYIKEAADIMKDAAVSVGAQNVCNKESGAYTGEVSAPQLSSVGAKYVIIGHSERRAYYGETDKSVNEKIKIALEHGLFPIVCVGETLEMREQGITGEHISIQVKLALSGIAKDDMKRITIAYEPIWAIGTGKTATPDEAEEVCALIRGVLQSLYGADTAEATRILYGGSMNAKNAAELLKKPDIDGGLIGGASLKSADFLKIVEAGRS